VAVHEHTGLLVERVPRRYGFMHLTFEEYFTARYLISHSKKRAQRIRLHLHQAHWHEPILLALGFVGLDYPDEASELLEMSILVEGIEAQDFGFAPSAYERLLGRDFLFSLRCLGDNILMRSQLLKRLCEQLADELLYDKGPARFERYRQALNEILPSLGRSEGAFLLVAHFDKTLQDSSTEVRYQTAESLGHLGQFFLEAMPELHKELLKAESRVRRRDAARLLGNLGQGDKATLDTLWCGLLDKDTDVRRACIQALVQLAKRDYTLVQPLEQRFIQSIHDTTTPQTGRSAQLPSPDTAYEGLWMLVTNTENASEK